MAGKILELENLIQKDGMACGIATNWHTWDMDRQKKIAEWQEVREYVYATDTSQTGNASLPWKNKTTIPKLCQIADNLYANYMATLFPKRKWLTWEGEEEDDNTKTKRDAIEDYMGWVVAQPRFEKEAAKLVLDFIQYGNAFAMPEWIDETVEQPNKLQTGYIGPMFRRISPLDIVFNPIAPSFEASPKIIRSLISLGELKETITRLNPQEDEKENAQAMFDYFRNLRMTMQTFTGALKVRDAFFSMDGFMSFQQYLQSNYVEVLTFYGDLYDINSDQFYKNHIITVVDRHKVISIKPNPSYFGTAPIWQAGWRVRQDNLWAMGPLDNLLGMQYRIDHLENMKADLMDLTTYPPLKIKGYVEDFTWGPFEKIYVGDDGDVSLLNPEVQALQVNTEIQQLENTMEEMAGAPKEAMGIRSPGEKTAYEVQRLESAAGRIFQSKIKQFEQQIVEGLLNGMLELARRNMTGEASIRAFDDELQFVTFRSLTAADLTGSGRIRPYAARHFAERAELIQNLNNYFNSAMGQDELTKLHFSTVQIAKMVEELFDLEDYRLIIPYIRLTEQAEAQRMANSHQENVAMEAGTPSGLQPDDTDQPTNLQGAASGPTG